jgi:hypothetical protein
MKSKKEKKLTLMGRGLSWIEDIRWATEEEKSWLRVLEYKPVKEIRR